MDAKHKGAVIAHIDMDCFYCAVERGLDPSLQGVPMAVAQYNPFGDTRNLLPTDNRKIKGTGSLIAVSYEARAAGVKRTMRCQEACKVCPQLVLVQVPVAYGKADIGIYRSASDKVIEVLNQKYKCVVEKASIDEVYLDVTEEAKALFQKCSNLWPDNNGKNGLDFYKDIFLETSVLLAGEDEEELSMDKKVLSKGHEKTTFSGSDMLGDSGGSESGTKGIPDACSTRNDGQLAASCRMWSKRSPRDWLKEEHYFDQLLVCGAYLIQQLREHLFQKTGYTSSAGIAHNKMLAKVASAMHKPNKMTIMPGSIVPLLMKSLPLNRLKGFGGKLGDELKSHFQIETAGDLLAVDEKKLWAKYPDPNQVQSVSWMLAMARGEVFEPVKSVTASQIISCGKTFRGKLSLSASSLTDGKVLQWIGDMSKELVGRLEDMATKHDMYPASIGVNASVQEGASSSNVANISKNASIYPNVRLPGGGHDATMLASQAFNMLKSAINKCSSLPSPTTANQNPPWIITSIYLNATKFIKRASEKQSISSFFRRAEKDSRNAAEKTDNDNLKSSKMPSTKQNNSENEEGEINSLCSNATLDRLDEEKGPEAEVESLKDDGVKNAGDGVAPCFLGHEIDMDVFHQLPAEIQQEIKSSYSSNEGTFRSLMKNETSKCDDAAQSSPLRVSSGVTVNALVSERMREKAKMKRESSGLHLYFEQKSNKKMRPGV